MKTNRKMSANLLKTGCISAMIMLTYGCSKDNPLNPAGNCFGGNWAENYTDEFLAWSNAASTYSEGPTTVNCAEYKNAAMPWKTFTTACLRPIERK